MTYETKVLSLIVKPEGEEIFSERATIITAKDEAGGVFYVIEQQHEGLKVTFDPAEWPHIVAAMGRIIGEWEGNACVSAVHPLE